MRKIDSDTSPAKKMLKVDSLKTKVSVDNLKVSV